ncbi:MAG: hypothetical protein Fur0046_18690 [Cyanobacteria bacterium J069]|nr:MAG: hypothetical protein D6742_09755 [Cyanobacteria bacterium J069]
MSTKTYKIFAARDEDAHQGWIWLRDKELPKRCVVTIRNGKKRVCCEALQIDANFLRNYDGRSYTVDIGTEPEPLVIGEWYRAALGGLETQSKVELIIEQSIPIWGSFRACVDHPQIVVRLATWLGVIGLVLGVLGFIIGVASLF